MIKLAGVYGLAFAVSSLIFGLVMSFWGTSAKERLAVGLKAGLSFGLILTIVIGLIHGLIVAWRRFS